MPETLFGMHLHLEKNHGLLWGAALAAPRPERPIKSMVRRFQFRSLKAIQRIARRIRPKEGRCRGACSTHGRQQQRNQIRRALKEAIEPVIRFQTPPPDNTRPTASPPGK